jgi:hypothetical protein
MKIPLEEASVTLIEVYVPAATVTLSATSEESVCSRVISKLAFDVGENMGIGLPLDGVSVIPTIGIVKLSKLTPVGGVSNIEIDTVALPVGPQLVQGGDDFKPLQEVSATAAVTARNASKPLERMHTPHDRIWRVGQILAFGNPQATVSLCVGSHAARYVLPCPTSNCPPTCTWQNPGVHHFKVAPRWVQP